MILIFKKIFVISLIFILCGCSTPGTAFLGPAFTGATTQNVAQTTLSFGTSQLIRNFKETTYSKKNKKIVYKVDNYSHSTELRFFHK